MGNNGNINAAVPETTSETSELPEGWAQVKLADICSPPQYGWTTSAEKNGGKVKLLRTTDISGGHVDWDTVPNCQEEPPNLNKYLLEPGDIVVSRAGSVGINYLVTDCPSAVFASYLIRFCPIRPISSEFVSLFMATPQYWSAIADHSAGIAVPNVNASKLKTLDVPLPPLAEQKRIVAKVEALLERVDKARERLDRLPDILKKFRQSVLAAACSGRLTTDWREERGNEDTSSVVDEIDSCRRERYEANNSTRYQSSLEPRIEQEYDFPEEWPLLSLDRLTCLVTSGSRGWAKYYSDDGPLFVRAQNINTDELCLDDAAHVTPPDSAEGRRTRVQQHDLLITITGANVTKSAIVRNDIGEAYVSQHVAIARPVDPRVAAFLYLWLIGPAHGREKLSADAYGAGKPGLNLTNIRDMPVALPSLEEQGEIVRRVDRLLAIADRVETNLTVGTKRAERITQSVLARAFAGELVETEADLARREGHDYEPASVLLERISSERELQLNQNSIAKARNGRHFTKSKKSASR